MRVLVTGGAGFIGSHIVDRLINLGYEVAIIDNLSTGNKNNVNKYAQFFYGDILDDNLLTEVFFNFKPKIVVHHAAQSNAQKSINNPINDCETNILGTINLLEMARTFNIEKFIYASSAAVYGETGCIKIDEYYQKQPISFYGISKMTPEFYIETYHKIYGLKYTIFRYSNVYGPRQNPHGEGGVISVFINQMLNDINPTIYGDGTQTRDFIYVDDVVEANLAALNMDVCGIFNISTNIETSINELFELLNNVLKKKYELKYSKWKDGDILRSCLDNSKAKDLLEWKPNFSLKQGIEKTIEYYVKTIKKRKYK
ncbi:NAD-dependent epimerase/dehydratase family protein [Caloranaerobacter ferrireducens]|uniref:NAD-dependent epimerase/dehydratase family protein n=1 Tax=Caloranaerobacter ferrireducens TaxID=1323370 RepID=UPI00084DD72A|nr:NAD-dependent epimerase/dehydratase family protein [Caloranaerobacter ferrireducens]